MSQFTNWLIETHPEYVKGSRILEQVQGPVTNLICPSGLFELIRTLPKEGGKIQWANEEFEITSLMVNEAYTVDKHYYPIRTNDFILSPKERKKWKESSNQTDEDIDELLRQAKSYLQRGTLGALAGWLPGWWKESGDKEDAIRVLMKWKGWEWKEVTFPPSTTTSLLNPISYYFGGVGNRNLLVIKKSKYDAERYDDMDKIPPGGTPPTDPNEPPKQTPPYPGGNAPGGGGGTGGGTGGRTLDQDDIELNKQLKISQDKYTQMLADAENKKKMDIERKQKEKAATVSATKPPGAGGGVPPGAGGGVPPGATGTGVPPGATGTGTGTGAADDIFLKPPEKVSPNLQKYDQYHLRNRPKISNAMAGVVEHLSKHGLEVYVNGRSLTIMDDTQETPVPIHKGLLDNAEHDSAIYKELWKASLNPKVNTQLGGEDLQQVLKRFGFNKMDFSDYNVQTPDQLKSRSSYGAAPIPKYNADDLNKGSQFWRFK